MKVNINRWMSRTVWMRLAALTMGTSLILGDCDPTIQATVEDGVIETANTLLSSFIGAFVQLVQEAQSNANTNGV